MRKLRSRLSLFSREEGQPSASRGSRPTVAKARRGLNSWGSQAELTDELDRGLSLSRSSAANEGERLDDDDAISLTSSDPVAGALLGYAQEEQEMSEGEEAETESAQSSCPAYDELLEVMAPRRGLACRGSGPRWRRCEKKKKVHFLSRFPLASIGFSIPVMLTLRGCVETAMRDAPCGRDASQLSLCGRDILSQGSLPSKPLQKYAAAGQAVTSLHTMAVLQAFQADLLKDLDKGQGLSPFFFFFFFSWPVSNTDNTWQYVCVAMLSSFTAFFFN